MAVGKSWEQREVVPGFCDRHRLGQGELDDELGAVLSRTVSGGVTVNNTAFHVVQEDLPFGGVGPSGMGDYHGRAGFDRFSKLKPVFIDKRISSWSLLRPPYGRRFRALMRLLGR